MTIEEAKEYFGEKFVDPNLKFFNEETSKFQTGVSTRISKAKLKHRYWYHFNIYQKDFKEQFGKSSGWVLGTVVFRRHGIAFMKFEGSKDKNFQYEFYDGSDDTQNLIPEVISKKEFKNYNPDMNFIFKDFNGMVKFE